MILALLAAEIPAEMGRDPGKIYSDLTREFGEPIYERVEASATPEQKAVLEKLSPGQVKIKGLAGEKIQAILTNAPGNGAPKGDSMSKKTAPVTQSTAFYLWKSMDSIRLPS
jgi:phosphoglucomutase